MTMFYVNYEGDVSARQNYPFYDEALALTKGLVAIPSQNNLPHGERDIALHIADWMDKILPCFYVIGKPTHSGQGFEGFSASMVAAEIVRNIDMRAEFCDVYNHEYTMPPTVLKMRDLKPSYDVQTAFSAFVYFNYFIHNMEMDDVFARLRKVAQDALAYVDEYTDRQNQEYCKMTGAAYYKREYALKVLYYSELYDMVKSMKPDVDADIDAITRKALAENQDRRALETYLIEG